jgi:hypothetical protein
MEKQKFFNNKEPPKRKCEGGIFLIFSLLCAITYLGSFGE